MKKISILLLITVFHNISLKAQHEKDWIPSKETTLEMIYWLRDNPLGPSDSLFIEKNKEIIKWKSNRSTRYGNYIVRGIQEITNDVNYPYSREIQTTYIHGHIVYEIEPNKRRNYEINSCYFSILFVIEYYKNLLLKDEDLKNNLLENYINLEQQGKLKEHIKQLLEKPVEVAPWY